MGARRQGRELALQILFSQDFSQNDRGALLEIVLEDAEPGAAAGQAFADGIVRGVQEHRREIDALIAGKSKNWALGRMSKVDLNILRLAVYELLFRNDIPKNVTINEAIEVAKKYGTEESPAFVNGILDEVASGLPEK